MHNAELYIVSTNKNGKVFNPAASLYLVVNYIVVYDFTSSVADVIHPSNPLHLVIHFKLFGNTFFVFELLD
jgi:hypothetical protein